MQRATPAYFAPASYLKPFRLSMIFLNVSPKIKSEV